MQTLPQSALSIAAATALLWLAGCGSVSPDQANEATERLLTRAAEVTLEAQTSQAAPTAATSDEETASAPEPSPAPPTPSATLAPTPTPNLPPIYARCIIRSRTDMRLEPNSRAALVAQLNAGEVITVYGRTRNRQWVLGWNRDDRFGWVATDSRQIGCSVPVAELKPAEPDVLVKAAATPTPLVLAQAPRTPTAPKPTATLAPSPLEPTFALPDETATPAPLSPTADVLQLEATPAALLPGEVASQSPIIVTVIVTVTAPPATPLPTPTTVYGVVSGLNCTVTPGTPVNIRRGPSRNERLLGSLLPGGAFRAQGRNEDASWLYGTAQNGIIGWMIASGLTCEGDTRDLAIVDR